MSSTPQRKPAPPGKRWERTPNLAAKSGVAWRLVNIESGSSSTAPLLPETSTAPNTFRDRSESSDVDEFTAEVANTGGDNEDNTDPEHWARKLAAYDIFEEKAPAGFNASQKAGFDAVSAARLSVDFERKTYRDNVFNVEILLILASNQNAPHGTRIGRDADDQKRLDDWWGAHADRLSDVRRRLIALADAEEAAVRKRHSEI